MLTYKLPRNESGLEIVSGVVDGYFHTDTYLGDCEIDDQLGRVRRLALWFLGRLIAGLAIVQLKYVLRYPCLRVCVRVAPHGSGPL
jgi:hypothetical protein